MPLHRTSLRLILAALPAVLLLALVAGCNLVGPLSYLALGPGKIAAQHQLADVPTVVFLDDRSNVINPTTFRRVIAMKITEDLMVHAGLSDTISPVDAMALVGRQDRNSELMPIDEIGRAVGAQQIVYVEMYAFQRSPDGSTPRPYAAAQVRVIDVANRQRVFPASEMEIPAQTVTAMTREVDPSVFRNRAQALKLFEQLAEELGSNVAKLFYEHERVELGDRLEPR